MEDQGTTMHMLSHLDWEDLLPDFSMQVHWSHHLGMSSRPIDRWTTIMERCVSSPGGGQARWLASQTHRFHSLLRQYYGKHITNNLTEPASNRGCICLLLIQAWYVRGDVGLRLSRPNVQCWELPRP